MANLSTTIVTINGFQYVQTTNTDTGQIVSQVPVQGPQTPESPKAVTTKALALITALKAGTATNAQQQLALALILAIQLDLLDV